MLTSSGHYCESCGVCADSVCIQTAELVLKCKENFMQSTTADRSVCDQLHMWVKGNLTQTYSCCICERDIDYHGRPGLYGSNVVKLSSMQEFQLCFFAGRLSMLLVPAQYTCQLFR